MDRGCAEYCYTIRAPNWETMNVCSYHLQEAVRAPSKNWPLPLPLDRRALDAPAPPRPPKKVFRNSLAGSLLW